jgi:hypothetical protein
MRALRLLSAYRWPIFLGALLAMSIGASAVIVFVATRPDTPRPMRGYYEAAQAWDADEAVEAASRQLGWSATFELPTDIPHMAGMPRPIDVLVVDRDGQPVTGLSGRLFAIRPSDTRLNQTGDLVALPHATGRYRTLVRLDAPGLWDLRLDMRQTALRFVYAARFTVPSDGDVGEGGRK